MDLSQNKIFEICRNGDLQSLQELVSNNPDCINMQDEKGFTPLILSGYNNHPLIVEYLLNHKANQSLADAAGNSALMGVCFKGYLDIVEQLLKYDPPINQRNLQGACALTFAVSSNHTDIALLLLENGADLTLPDLRGKSPLDYARIQENWELFDLMSSYNQSGE